jgi:hypothetical protein
MNHTSRQSPALVFFPNPQSPTPQRRVIAAVQ